MNKWLPYLLGTALLGGPAIAHAEQAPADITRVVPSSQAQVQLSYSPVVKQTAPAVVNIFTSIDTNGEIMPSLRVGADDDPEIGDIVLAIGNPFGARTNSVDATMASALGLDRAKGAVINELLDGGPADKAGLEKGDVILAVGDTEVNDDSGLRFKLATLRPRENTSVEYVRDGRIRTTKVRVDTPQETPLRDERDLEGVHPFNGAVIVNMSPALGEELGFDPYLEGVMVLKVLRGSAANYNRLRPGDFILDVNNTPITSTRQLESLLISEPIDVVWDVQIDRDGRIGSLPLCRRQNSLDKPSIHIAARARQWR